MVDSFKRLGRTLYHVKQHRKIFWFLVAYFFYIDGVDTIFTMATAIGKDLGIETTMLMLVLLMVQLIAFPCSTTGFALNPARDWSPRLAYTILPVPNKGKGEWSYAWVPMLGPLAGSLFACWIEQLATI